MKLNYQIMMLRLCSWEVFLRSSGVNNTRGDFHLNKILYRDEDVNDSCGEEFRKSQDYDNLEVPQLFRAPR